MGVDLQMDHFPLPAQYRTQESKSPKPERQRKSRKSIQNMSNAKIDLLTSKVTSYRNSKHNRKNGSEREGRSTVPRTIQTAIIASPTNPIRSRSAEPSMRASRSVDMGMSSRSPDPSVRGSRSVTPSMRESRSVDMGTSPRHHRGTSSRHDLSVSAEPSSDMIRSSRSVEPSSTKAVIQNMRSRSADPVIRADNRSTRETRSCSPSRNQSASEMQFSSADQSSSKTNDQSSSKTRSSSQKSRTRSSERREEASSSLRISDAIPYRLNKDMTVLADGMNLDQNARNLLAAYDSKTLEDFYLMSDSDFSSLVHRSRSHKHPLPPLQIRKVQMLRRWMKELVDDNINENEDTNSRSLRSKKRNVRLIPKDWKEQYKNDLPHLKLQLREQGDSIFERIKNLSESFTCGAAIMY
jgi:hypothetical protein